MTSRKGGLVLFLGKKEHLNGDKAIFNSLLKSDMKNFQNQKDCYDLLLNMKIDLKFDDKQIKNYALKISQYTHKMADYMAG